MPNLKPYYDAALAADAEVKRVLNDMDVAFNEGTEEGKSKALELRPALDEAKAKAQQANELYISMRDASLVNDKAASLFVHPADPGATGQQGADPKVMNRAAFRELDPAAQMKFIKAGGQLED